MAVTVAGKKQKIIVMNTILVVEDGLTDREILSFCLQRSGYYVVNATNSEEMQAKLDLNKPDLIFLDVILPKQSGFEICEKLKTNPTTKQIPVVLCSTKNSDVDKMWGIMLGADAYISKPINQSEIIRTAQQLIQFYDNRTRN
jgi:chemotaxis family two-component system response regulator PixH